MSVVAITGGAGFIGRRVGEALAARGTLVGADGKPVQITEIRLIDVVPALNLTHPLLRSIVVPGLDAYPLAAAIDKQTSAVFHLAAIVSGGAEADFDLGWRVNVDGTRTLLELLRALGSKPRVVYTSSVAAFGGDMPKKIPDDFAPRPMTSYGAQKVIGELMVADFSRKGFLDGRSLRLPTIVVRPGKPNAAASSFFSGIIREPTAGAEAILPVPAESTSCWLLSPERVVAGLIRAMDLEQSVWGSPAALNLNGLSITVSDMLAALERVAGPQVRALVKYQHDPVIAKIVAGWAYDFEPTRAQKLGFEPDRDFDSIIRAYIAAS
jgi:nucleoside-diphosphate-sugar epimerase